MREDWIEHRRGRDGERIGWIRPENDSFVAIDLLGRDITGAVDWQSAEDALDTLGLGYLAEPFELQLDSGQWLRVRLAEVSTDGIRAKKDDWGDMTAPQVYYTVPFPIPPTLRPLE
ncbi:MAG: hypothetical protein ABIS08_00440 [Pseudolysinimonas sp.]